MVKAGPKKRRVKNEEAAIRAAVEEHGRRGKPRAGRKAGRVTTYSYKETDAAKRRRADRYLAEMQRVFGMREPKHEREFLDFYDDLKPDEQPLAVKLFQMTCHHPKREVVATKVDWSSGEGDKFLACERCGTLQKHQAVTHMLRAEWNTYCPQGFDAFDWEDLFTFDKTLWRYIHDECLAEMVEDVLNEGGANG